MNKIDLGQSITILANVGVIVGIVFLLFEIRQNTAQLRSQASYSINQSVGALNQSIFQNAEFADLVYRGEQSFSDLGPVEQSRLAAFYFSEINLAQYIVGLEDEGLSDLHFRYVDFKVDQFISFPGRKEFVDAYVKPSIYFGRDDFQRRLIRE